MNERRFGLKGLFATGAGAASVAGGLGSVAAQEDDEVEDEGSDVEVSAPGEDPVVTSGDVTASVIDGVATVEVAEDDAAEDDAAEDDAAEDEGGEDDEVVAEDDDEAEDEAVEDDAAEGGEETEADISAAPSLAISDASGGDDNFAFAS